MFLSVAISAVSVPCATAVTYHFASIYTSLLSQKVDFGILVLNFIWLFVLRVSYASSIKLNHNFATDFDGWLLVLPRKVMIYWYFILFKYKFINNLLWLFWWYICTHRYHYGGCGICGISYIHKKFLQKLL